MVARKSLLATKGFWLFFDLINEDRQNSFRLFQFRKCPWLNGEFEGNPKISFYLFLNLLYKKALNY